MEVLTEQGYACTGLNDLLQGAGVPKGSFYHYFTSKEDYLHAVIAAYAAYFARKLDRWLLNESRPPLARLADFVADGKAGMRRHDFRRGCLIGNLGQELASTSDTLRPPLDAVFRDWQARVARCLELARAAGEIAAATDCQKTAEFFWIGWEGAILRAKLVRSEAPIDLFAETFFDALTRSENSLAKDIK
ncbi:TetR/AcrR family transcriptional regulator [Shimia sp.]|uniref:acrylate utilization transcriptional regulator AcuR n=1 Tax=Shimia sp. TaxID=1954381 RepID=UPI003562A9C0